MQSNSTGIPLPTEQAPGWLTPLRSGFLALLVSLDLKTGTVKDYARAIDWLCVEVGRRGLLTPDGVDTAMFEQIRDRLPARLSDFSRQRWTYVLDRFIGYLVKEDAIAVVPAAPQLASASTTLETLCTDYGIWLHTQRGSAPSTIQLRQRKLRHFPLFRFNDAAPGDLSAITRADIVAYLGVTGKTGLVGARSEAGSLRSLFRFLYATGRIDQNLALCVPRISRPRPPARSLEPRALEQVRRHRTVIAGLAPALALPDWTERHGIPNFAVKIPRLSWPGVQRHKTQHDRFGGSRSSATIGDTRRNGRMESAS